MWTSPEFLNAVRALKRCMFCGRVLPRGIACHRNMGKGMGIKASDAATACGCHECHAMLDQGAMPRDERRATMDGGIVDTLVALIERGDLILNPARRWR